MESSSALLQVRTFNLLLIVIYSKEGEITQMPNNLLIKGPNRKEVHPTFFFLECCLTSLEPSVGKIASFFSSRKTLHKRSGDQICYRAFHFILLSMKHLVLQQYAHMSEQCFYSRMLPVLKNGFIHWQLYCPAEQSLDLMAGVGRPAMSLWNLPHFNSWKQTLRLEAFGFCQA